MQAQAAMLAQPFAPQASPLCSAQQQLAANGHWQGLAHVLGMHCGACSLVLESRARGVDGLEQLHINPATGLAHWVASQPLAIDTFVQRIAALGYGLCPWGGDTNAHALAHAQRQLRHVFLRALVALLCMMQIMMYSAPEYLYSPEAIGHEALMLLRWAQWVLSLPLMLYCALPFLQRAWQAARARCWAMDQPIALGLLIAFVTSMAHMHQPLLPVWFDCIGMLLAVLLGTQWLLQRHRVTAMQALMQHPLGLPSHVDCKPQKAATGPWHSMAVTQLQEGHCFTLPAHTTCPVDAKLAADQPPVWVDEAMRTGEPTPVCKHPGSTVWAGSRLLSPGALLVALHSAAHSSLARLGQDVQQALAQKPSTLSLHQRLLPHWAAAILLCAAASAAAWAYVGDAGQATRVAVAVLLVSCPCALALAQPLVHLMAMHKLKHLGVVVRQPDALATLAKANCLAFDKTGTLSPRQAAQVHCTAVFPNPALLPNQPLALLHALAQHIAQASAHPVAQAIRTHVVLQNPQALATQDQEAQHNWPLAAVVETPGLGLEAHWTVANHSVRVRLGAMVWCGQTLAPDLQDMQPQPGAHTHAALEVRVPNGPILGQLHFTLHWQGLEQKAHAALTSLCTTHHVAVLSGDTQAATQAWQPELPIQTRMGGLHPQDKTAWVQAQQRQGRVVAMVGDGLNDSSAFAAAHVSMAVAGAAYLAASQADFILTPPQYKASTVASTTTSTAANSAATMATDQPPIHPAFQVEEALRIAQKAQTLAQQNLAWALLYNTMAIPLAASGQLQPWMAALGMGLSSLVVLANAMRLRL